jgi:hypothetical protein
LFAAEENGGQKTAMVKKNFFLNDLFQWEHIFFPKIFFLFLMYNYRKFMMKKGKKSKKKFFNGKKDGETVIGYTFRVGYIYRADCIYLKLDLLMTNS